MWAVLVLAAMLSTPVQAPETVADIRVHGNTLTSDEDLVRLAGVQIGAALEPRTIDEIAMRLRRDGRFAHVEVLKRFASIEDPSKVLIVIVVDEGPVKIETSKDGSTATVTRSRRVPVMFLPVFDYEDGYGLSYGVRIAIPDVAGANSRLSFPATWGGERRAGVQLEKELTGAPLSRVQGGGQIVSRENPFFHATDGRDRTWISGERDFGRSVRASGTAAWQRVSFLGAHDSVGQIGADLVLDTRIDPVLPRNAVYARVAWDHLTFRSQPSAHRTEVEGRGYIGLVGQTVLVVRAIRQDSNIPLPDYLRPLLGGSANARGFRAGSAIGDTLAALSAELRIPLTSPLSVGKIGLDVFLDNAAIYHQGQQFGEADVVHGVGGGVWFSAAFLRVSLSVAHGIAGSTRVHLGTSLIF